MNKTRDELLAEFEEAVRPLWVFIPRKWQWMGVDGDGLSYTYMNQPFPNEGIEKWDIPGGVEFKFIDSLGCLIIPIPDGLTWQDTLVQRPATDGE